MMEQHIAADKGHLDIVRWLVESGATKDPGRTDNRAAPLHIAAEKGHLEVQIKQRPRQDRQWSNACFHFWERH